MTTVVDALNGLPPAEQARLAHEQTLIYARELRQLYQSERQLRLTMAARVHELESANQDLAALHAIADSALLTLDVEELLDGLLGGAVGALDGAVGLLLLVREDRQQLQVRSAWGISVVADRQIAVPADAGIVGRVLHENRSLLSSEASVEPALSHPSMPDVGVRSIAVVPLRVDGRPVGAVLVGWRCHDELPARSLSVLEATAERAAAAVKLSQLYRVVAEQRTALAGANRAIFALQRSMAKVASTAGLEEVLSTILDACSDGLGYRYAALWLYQAGRARVFFSPGTLDEVDRRGRTGRQLPIVLDQALDATDNLAVQVFLDRRPRLATSFYDLVRPYLPPERATAVQQALGIATIAAIPLVADGRCLGVLAAASTVDHPIVEADLPRLALFAGQAATAIEYARLNEELHDREQQVSLLLKATIDAQEEERERICLEIHDGVAQTLAPAFQYLQALENRLFLDDAVRANVRKASALVRDAIREAREVIATLRPAALDTLGLIATLRHELADLCEQTRLEIDFDADPARFPKAVETALYRIVHEAVTNVVKHAHARQVVVRVKREDDRIVAEIVDDGVGFDVARLDQQIRRKGVGLLSMRKRAELLQGSFEVTSKPGKGTRVRVVVPLPTWDGQQPAMLLSAAQTCKP